MARDELEAAHPPGHRIGHSLCSGASLKKVLFVPCDQVDVLLKMIGLVHAMNLRNALQDDNTASSPFHTFSRDFDGCRTLCGSCKGAQLNILPNRHESHRKR